MAISDQHGVAAKLKMEGIEEIPVAALEEYDGLFEQECSYTRAVEQFGRGLLTQLKAVISKLPECERKIQNAKLRITIAVLEERTAEVTTNSE